MKDNPLKQIIAESMYAGSLLAEQKYSGNVNDLQFEPLIKSYKKLRILVHDFIKLNQLEQIDFDHFFPLLKEIENIKT